MAIEWTNVLPGALVEGDGPGDIRVMPGMPQTALFTPGDLELRRMPAVIRYTQVRPVIPPGPTPGQEITPGQAAPAALPLIGGAISLGIWLVRLAPAIARYATRMNMTIAATIAWIRKNAFIIAISAGWAAVGIWLSDVLNLDQDEGMRVALEIAGEGQKKKRKRYSIGHNPRVQTLQRVARHTMKLLKRHQKYIKEFFPTPSRRGELAARERAHHRLIGKAVD